MRRLGLWTDALARAFGLLHVDLLPIARRLWGHRWHDRRLVHLESALLHAQRTGDVAGADIAAIGRRWLDGARTAELARMLDRVVVHNAFDLVGLAALLGRAIATCRAPGGAAQAVAVARHLARIDRADAARAVLADVAHAAPLVDYFCERLRSEGIQRVETGVFGAMMQVEIHNDGPVTIWLDSDDHV